MKKQLSVVSYQRSAKKLVIFSLLLFAVSFIFNYSFEISACASDIADKGALTIPKRQGDSKQGSERSADVDDIVNRIQKKFSELKDIRGTFSQSSYIKDIEQIQKYSGIFFIKKPSRMMWEYTSPRDEKVIIKDTDTWIYKKSEKQVIKMKFTKKAYSRAPIALLERLENIRTDFDITMTEENALQLKPKQRVGMIKTLVLETVSEDFPVKMFTIFDTYGNIIMIELNNVETNSGLDDSLFIFKVPPGVEVFDMSR